jgi:RNA-directed DNA polymerase
LLHRGNPTPWPELRSRLNRLLSGWTEYFSVGHTSQAYGAIHWHVGLRVRRFLCRRHKLGRGTGRFGFGEVYGEVGVLDLYQKRPRSAAHALS